jgi:hypothetical protein
MRKMADEGTRRTCGIAEPNASRAEFSKESSFHHDATSTLPRSTLRPPGASMSSTGGVII